MCLVLDVQVFKERINRIKTLRGIWKKSLDYYLLIKKEEGTVPHYY
jgi:hypothetical protein